MKRYMPKVRAGYPVGVIMEEVTIGDYVKYDEASRIIKSLECKLGIMRGIETSLNRQLEQTMDWASHAQLHESVQGNVQNMHFVPNHNGKEMLLKKMRLL